MKPVQLFGTVTSISKGASKKDGEDCLLMIALTSAGVTVCIPVYVTVKEARELAPGDEFRVDIARTGFTERSAASLGFT